MYRVHVRRGHPVHCPQWSLGPGYLRGVMMIVRMMKIICKPLYLCAQTTADQLALSCKNLNLHTKGDAYEPIEYKRAR